MATGYSSVGHCWPTVSEALDAYYSAQPIAHGTYPLYTTAPGTYWTFDEAYFTKDAGTGVWSLVVQQLTYNGTAISTARTIMRDAPTNVVGSCTLAPSDDPVASFTDGHLLGWGVVAAMALTWGVMAMRRAIG